MMLPSDSNSFVPSLRLLLHLLVYVHNEILIINPFALISCNVLCCTLISVPLDSDRVHFKFSSMLQCYIFIFVFPVGNCWGRWTWYAFGEGARRVCQVAAGRPHLFI